MALWVQLVTTNVFAPPPPVNVAASIFESVSVPTPTRPESERVKLMSPDSTILLKPSPPSSVSSPASPVSTLSNAFPMRRSLPAEPTRFSMPTALESENAKPGATICADIDERSIDTPTPATTVSSEKSIVSLPASAASTIATLPVTEPTNS